MSPSVFASAWQLAEQQLLAYFGTFTGFPPGKSSFIGDAIDLTGRIDTYVFQIDGGQDQSQGYETGATVWQTNATVRGVFLLREKAFLLSSLFLRPLHLPLEEDPGGNCPNVVRAYVRAHPSTRRAIHELANQTQPVLATFIDIPLTVVYQSLELNP